MLLDVLKEESSTGQTGDDLTRTLNDISQQHNTVGGTAKPKATIIAAAAAVTTSPVANALNPHERKFSFSGERKFSFGERRNSFNFRFNAKTDKDKFNSKERRNSRYFVRSADKETIQCRVNSLRRAVNTVMEHSGLYDQKSRRGSRKYSITNLNIPESISAKSDAQLTPPLIIEPSGAYDEDGASITNLSPLPEQRRTSMDEYFFSSLNLPVPKQFADASSRRSSGIAEPIKEEEGNGHSQSDDVRMVGGGNEHNYDVGYLYGSDDKNCESAVPHEVYERNLLRATMQQQQQQQLASVQVDREPSPKSDDGTKSSPYTLQVPTITMSDVDMMERNLLNVENVYTSENMTIIDTDNAVSHSNHSMQTFSTLTSVRQAFY